MNNKQLSHVLMMAIKRHQLAPLEKYLEEGGNPDFRCSNGEKLISLALLSGQEDAVKLLVKYNVDLTTVDNTDGGPLVKAVRSSSPAIIECILKASGGGNKDQKRNSLRALHEAISLGLGDEVKMLVAYGVRIDKAFTGLKETPWSVMNKSSPEIFGTLLEAGVSPELGDAMGRNALHHVAVSGDEKAILKLVDEYKMNPNSTDALGHTPLHLAVDYGHTNVCKILLSRGADVNLMNKDNMDPITLVNEKNHTEQQDYQTLREILAEARMKAMGVAAGIDKRQKPQGSIGRIKI